ncbi:TIGR02281 family clan AA aspartic protease [Georhizobium sp. MAB10]|uniref:TIGR02281 family clan AA aspartic protease n=1 Tax=Georhizobium sp. MAB10 TaxID=3028319 RepID=UPI003855C012
MRRNPVIFYVAMAILATGLGLLLWNHSAGQTLGLDNDQFGNLVTGVALLTVLSSAFLIRGRFGQMLKAAVIWAVIILAFSALYVFRYDIQSLGTRLQAGLMPGTAAVRQLDDGTREVVIQKAMGGQFATEISVNGEPVGVMVDTGASLIALAYDDAEQLGLEPENLSYSQPVSTANGQALAAIVTLDEVAIGPIVRSDVRALVSEDGALSQSLLGMNFIGELSSFEMRRDELILRD